MSVIIELKDGSELAVTEKMPSLDKWIYLTKEDVNDLIINREPVPLELPTGKIERDMWGLQRKGFYISFVIINPADILIVKEQEKLPFDKIAFLKQLYGPGWERFKDMY